MWETFGLRSNPFEINAVEKEGIIPISTFVGRLEDRTKLKDTIKTRERSLSLIVGDKGVGKTSLGNIVRFDLSAEYFTAITEIDCQSDWSAEDFIIQIISLLYEQEGVIKLYDNLPKQFVDTAKFIHNELKPLFIDENSGFNIQAGVQVINAGVGFSRGMKINRYTINSLKITFKKLINIAVKNGYKGVILQFNNLDNLELDLRKLSRIFGDMRDFLLSEKTHFIFLGNKVMEGSFKDNPKVGDCISSDVQLGPLPYPEILKILKKRYDVFKIENRNILSPVSEDATKMIYDLYEGNIRHIFYSLDKAVVNAESVLNTPLHTLTNNDIERILYKLAYDRINERIEPRAAQVLLYMIKKHHEVTNSEVAKHFKIKTQNTSKYLKKLKDNNLITSIDYGGREVYYKIVEEAKWLLLNPKKGQQKYISESL